jgi:hypothetical protein
VSSHPIHPAPARTGGSAAGVLFGLGVVLGAMALALLVLGLWQHQDSTQVCGMSGASMGDCLVTADLAMRETRLIWVGALTLGVGSITSVIAGAIATRLER